MFSGHCVFMTWTLEACGPTVCSVCSVVSLLKLSVILLPCDLSHLAPGRQFNSKLFHKRLDFRIGEREEICVTLFPRSGRGFQLRIVHPQMHDQHCHAGL